MDIGVIIVLGIILAVAVMLWWGAVRIERRYYQMHPPDDAVREDDNADD